MDKSRSGAFPSEGGVKHGETKNSCHQIRCQGISAHIYNHIEVPPKPPKKEVIKPWIPRLEVVSYDSNG